MLPTASAGLLTGLSLIIAIGAQNAYVLRQGLLRSHVGPVVLVCAVSDLVLILAGVAGIGVLVDRAGWLVEVVRWLGVAFLLWYAAASLRRARHPESLGVGAAVGAERRRTAVGRAMALTWLNPHVYLDTVLLIGSLAAAQGSIEARWWFGAGAATASVWWFASLGFGARLLAPLLRSPRAWQMLEMAIAATMLFVAAMLARG
ncbi:LysE/ArgO family amino acid transporter [Nocardioides alcanivorans]|uniref:LysE/ArgO family amino acid transporter n=1 Tax=Nocardioides alcanivorans TaxID=2897352 RepID=UPI001F39B707|nr:LysE/ArgO family amino acid transporter [Nocardioides alcanivorans]